MVIIYVNYNYGQLKIGDFASCSIKASEEIGFSTKIVNIYISLTVRIEQLIAIVLPELFLSHSSDRDYACLVQLHGPVRMKLSQFLHSLKKRIKRVIKLPGSHRARAC